MKGALDDFKVMLTRNEPLTGLARAVAFLVIFALGVVAGLWAAAGARQSSGGIVRPSITRFPSAAVYQPSAGDGVCCRPDPDAGFSEFVAPTRLMHDMTDEELFWRATLVPAAASYPFQRVPKVAFMFLAGHGVLPLAPLWERFFRGHEERFSIYVHAPPGVAINVSEDSPFHGRQIPSQETSWGSVSLMDAEKRLLANALLDFSNERFVLLSESCIPVHNFTTVYEYLVGSEQSFVEVYYRDTKQCRNRYSRRMAPDITLRQWRKGSQWFELARGVATSILTDTRYYTLFRRHCRPSCYPDEHYVQTYVAMRHGDRNSNRTVTHVDWSTGGAHPVAYGARDATPELVRSIRTSREPCTRNSRPTTTCYLFARKFAPDALGPLLNMSAAVMHY
ncbi:hypothetical protein SEVIR_5G404800v4 [Setaria viridis]|uniref:Uncharacterized protein n=1 Tax=Setaria viridis TaxID=4556 RepID=A0A4U6URL5_SETVI|nr:glycosyltransferase BC10-like [Setaria viridis]TKW17985.1 hypothetical protein SEVIR_5G404800v2 [Setaria viridis]